jgi:ketosteroid isomerase-like protein
MKGFAHTTALLLLTLAAAGAASADDNCANQLVQDFEDAYANGSASEVAALYGNNAVLEGDAFDAPLQGPAQIEAAEAFLFSAFCDVEWTVTTKVVQNKKIALRYDLTSTFCGPFPGPDGIVEPTGNRATLNLATFIRVNDNCKIINEYRHANIQDFFDFILTP